MSLLRRLHRWLGAHDGMTHIVAGTPAPNFSLKTLHTREFLPPSPLKKGPVFLSFFKVSSPVCKFPFPFLDRLSQPYQSAGVAFLGVSQDNASATRDFARSVGVT